MDKGTPKEIIPEIPKLDIPQMPQTDDWAIWYKFLHEELVKHVARIDDQVKFRQIFLQKAIELGDQDGKMILSGEIMLLMQLSTLTSLTDLTIQFQNRLWEALESIQRQNSKLTDMLEPLEPYLPQLKKFAEEKKKEDEEREKWR